MKRILIFILSLFFVTTSFAQNAKIDSLTRRIENLSKQPETFESDTDKVNSLILLSWCVKNIGENEKAKEYANTALTLSTKINYTKGIAEAHLKIGNVEDLQGDHLKALDNYFKALKLFQETGYKTGIGKTLANIGIVYQLLGDYPKALEYHFKGLKIGEEIGYKLLIINTEGNIGITYYYQKDYANALEYNFKALKMSELIGDKNAISRNATNVGNIYIAQKNYSKALEYYSRALKLAQESDYKQAVAILLGNIGSVYDAQGDLVKALENHSQQLKITQEMGDKGGIAEALGNIGVIYLKQKKITEAEDHLQKALKICDEIGDLNGQRQWHENLSELYSQQNDWKRSMEHYRKSVLAKDSIFNEDNTKKSVQAQMNYEFDKKQDAEKLEQEKRDAVAAEEKRRQQVWLWLIAAVAAAVAAIAVIIFRAWRITRKQKIVIDQKNKHITDSINYAKRIQDSILPAAEDLKKCFPEHFVFFQPREIVSGDFYWLSHLTPDPSPQGEGGNSRGKTILAVADCTGHGVPGAFMSMIGNTLLNEIVNEQKIIQPAEILNHLNEGIVHALHQESRSQDDGMDITMCLFDHDKNTLSFAGANHTLFLSDGKTLTKIEGDYFSIGNMFEKKNASFSQKEMALQKNTTVFLSTDGYADQPGGEKGKKFMTKRFEALLLSLSSLAIQEQEQMLRRTFQEWKNTKQQIDDVLVFGIKI